MPTTTIDLLLGKPLKHAHVASDITGLGTIGAAEDGTYTDGLFTDFTTTTPVGTAVDRFNEVLKALAPPPAPDLSTISIANTGVAGKLSFDATHSISGVTNVPNKTLNTTMNLNDNITDNGATVVFKGIFNASTVISGTLASSVSAHAYSYIVNAFGNGNLGALKLYVNDVLIRSVDLTSFTSGDSVDANGSGFINLSAATSVHFSSGGSFDGFKYRTGTYRITAASQRPGYNKVCVQHTIDATTLTTNYFGWIVDNNTDATVLSGASVSNLAMTGTKYISGVKYNTGGTAVLNLTIDNLHKNTFSTSSISFAVTGCSVAAVPIANVSASYTENQVLASTLTISSPAQITTAAATPTVLRTVQASASMPFTISSILVDSITDNTTNATTELFDGEKYRVTSNINTLDTTTYNSTGTSPSEWDSSISLVSGTAGYDGLLVAGGTLKYPKQGTNSGNYAGLANGPAGNVNYSSAAGNRTYLRYFYTPPTNPSQGFKFNVVCTSTSFVSVATGPSNNNVTLEICAPNLTTDGTNLGVWKDAVAAYSSEVGTGCYASSIGSTIPTNWGISLGSRSTLNSGNVILIRITAAAGWTGSIESITITWM